MRKNKNVLLKEGGFALLIATLFLLVCSKSSPLYPMNDWVDVDCIFTVGRSMTEGKVLYRDIFDHKGPILYFIFAISSLISSTSFIGLWLFEVVSMAGMLFFSMQSAKLFINSKWVIYATMPVTALVVMTTRAFTHGGSTEQLALFPLSYCLYYFLRLLQDKKLNKKEHILVGVCIGAIFWMKFTLVGFFIGAYIWIIIYRIYKKDFKNCVSDILWNIAGFGILTVPVLLYFIINGAMEYLWEVYFYDNIFLYSKPKTNESKFQTLYTRVSNMTFVNKEMILPVIISGAVYLFKHKKCKEMGFMALSFITMLVCIYMGCSLPYYAMITAVFAFLGMGIVDEACALIFENRRKRRGSNIEVYLPVLSAIICFILCFSLSSNRYLAKYEKEDLPQYKFAKRINSVEEPTLLNYRFLDGGFYFAADVMPQNRFFYRSNLKVPGMDEEQQQIIRDKEVDFVVTRQDTENKFVLACGYECVAKETFFFEGKDRTYYLYERKDLR